MRKADNLPPYCAVVTKSGSLKFSEPSRSVQACYGTALIYMEVMRTVVIGDHLRCGKHEFEHVKEFSYLGSQLNQTNCTNSDIQARILSGNRCYYAYGKLIKSRVLYTRTAQS